MSATNSRVRFRVVDTHHQLERLRARGDARMVGARRPHRSASFNVARVIVGLVVLVVLVRVAVVIGALTASAR